jgi:glycosyltransferase involved in cell wall biosynthesis
MKGKLVLNGTFKALGSISRTESRWIHICPSANVPPNFDGSFNHLLWQIVQRQPSKHVVIAPFNIDSLRKSEKEAIPICYFAKHRSQSESLRLAILRRIQSFLLLKPIRKLRDANLECALKTVLDRFPKSRILLWGESGYMPMIRQIASETKVVFAQRHYDYPPGEAFYELCDYVIMQTRGQLRHAFSTLNRLTPFVAVIPNGVELDVFKPSNDQQKVALRHALGLPEDKVVCVLPGKLAPQKGLFYLPPIMTRAQTEIPSLHFLVVGGLFHSLPLAARDEISHFLKSQKNVTWVNGVSRPEMAQYYSLSDLCMMPCVWREGFSMASIEALASGLPVIAPNTGCYSEILGTGYNGITFPPENMLRGTLAALQTLTTDSCQRRSLSANARRYAEARLGREKCLRNFEAFLRDDIQAIDEELSFV